MKVRRRRGKDGEPVRGHVSVGMERGDWGRRLLEKKGKRGYLVLQGGGRRLRTGVW